MTKALPADPLTEARAAHALTAIGPGAAAILFPELVGAVEPVREYLVRRGTVRVTVR
jgi:hypothetical protein